MDLKISVLIVLLALSLISILVLAVPVPFWSANNTPTNVSLNSTFSIVWDDSDFAFIEGNWSTVQNYTMTPSYRLGSITNWSRSSNFSFENISQNLSVVFTLPNNYRHNESGPQDNRFNKTIENWTQWVINNRPFNWSITEDEQDVDFRSNFSIDVSTYKNRSNSSFNFYLVPNISWWALSTGSTSVLNITVNVSVYNWTSSSYQTVIYNSTPYWAQTGSTFPLDSSKCINLIEPVPIYVNDFVNSGRVNLSFSFISSDGASGATYSTSPGSISCGGVNMTTQYSTLTLGTFSWNYTNESVKNNFTYTTNLTALKYYWKSYANNSNNTWNSSDTFVFFINKTYFTSRFSWNPAFDMVRNGTIFDGSQRCVEYGDGSSQCATTIAPSCTCSGFTCPDSTIPFLLYRNGTNVNSTENQNSTFVVNFNPGIIEYVCNGTSDNYVGTSTTLWAIVMPNNITSLVATSVNTSTVMFNSSANNSFIGIGSSQVDIYTTAGTSKGTYSLAYQSGNDWYLSLTPSFCSDSDTYYVKFLNVTTNQSTGYTAYHRDATDSQEYSTSQTNFTIRCQSSGGGPSIPPPSTPSSTGGIVIPEQIVIYRNITGFCGDGICGEFESVNACSIDCTVAGKSSVVLVQLGIIAVAVIFIIFRMLIKRS